MGQAKPVPLTDLDKSREKVLYLPILAVVKESTSMFDGSAKSSSGVPNID